MGDVFFSFRGRVVINVEALNMVESVGNYVKHRRVPVVVPGQYVTYMVPAISGESIAHGYQYVLAQKAVEKGLQVCKLCRHGIFLKSTRYEVIQEAFLKQDTGEKKPYQWLGIDENTWNKYLNIKSNMKNLSSKERKQMKEELYIFGNKLANYIEKAIVRDCVVEDIGGFMYAENKFGGFDIVGIKRTSNFYTGYMIPVAEALQSIVIEPQLHTRYALGTKFVKGEGESRGQMIYYVEISSAPYTFSFDLDTRYIGRSTYSIETAGKPLVSEEEIIRRKIIALEAFTEFITEMMFGAKKTRFLPVIEWESFVIAVSDKTWTVPSPFTAKYIENAYKKKERIYRNTKLYVYKAYGEKSFEEVLLEAVEEAKKRVTG